MMVSASFSIKVVWGDLRHPRFSCLCQKSFSPENIFLILLIIYNRVPIEETHGVHSARVQLVILGGKQMLHLVTLTVDKFSVWVHLFVTLQHVMIVDIILIIMVLEGNDIVLVQVH